MKFRSIIRVTRNIVKWPESELRDDLELDLELELYGRLELYLLSVRLTL